MVNDNGNDNDQQTRTQCSGCVPMNDFGDRYDDKEARVACLSNDSEDSLVMALEGSGSEIILS